MNDLFTAEARRAQRNCAKQFPLRPLRLCGEMKGEQKAQSERLFDLRFTLFVLRYAAFGCHFFDAMAHSTSTASISTLVAPVGTVNRIALRFQPSMSL